MERCIEDLINAKKRHDKAAFLFVFLVLFIGIGVFIGEVNAFELTFLGRIEFVINALLMVSITIMSCYLPCFGVGPVERKKISTVSIDSIFMVLPVWFVKFFVLLSLMVKSGENTKGFLEQFNVLSVVFVIWLLCAGACILMMVSSWKCITSIQERRREWDWQVSKFARFNGLASGVSLVFMIAAVVVFIYHPVAVSAQPGVLMIGEGVLYLAVKGIEGSVIVNARLYAGVLSFLMVLTLFLIWLFLIMLPKLIFIGENPQKN